VQLTEAHCAESWSTREEQIIAAIQKAESAPRAEAIRRMRRHKLDDLKGRTHRPSQAAGAEAGGPRICRNPRCTRGDDGGRASLAHLRAGAHFCDDACRKSATRSKT
jgi:hypothetical protein